MGNRGELIKFFKRTARATAPVIPAISTILGVIPDAEARSTEEEARKALSLNTAQVTEQLPDHNNQATDNSKSKEKRQQQERELATIPQYALTVNDTAALSSYLQENYQVDLQQFLEEKSYAILPALKFDAEGNLPVNFDQNGALGQMFLQLKEEISNSNVFSFDSVAVVINVTRVGDDLIASFGLTFLQPVDFLDAGSMSFFNNESTQRYLEPTSENIDILLVRVDQQLSDIINNLVIKSTGERLKSPAVGQSILIGVDKATGELRSLLLEDLEDIAIEIEGESGSTQPSDNAIIATTQGGSTPTVSGLSGYVLAADTGVEEAGETEVAASYTFEPTDKFEIIKDEMQFHPILKITKKDGEVIEIPTNGLSVLNPETGSFEDPEIGEVWDTGETKSGRTKYFFTGISLGVEKFKFPIKDIDGKTYQKEMLAVNLLTINELGEPIVLRFMNVSSQDITLSHDGVNLQRLDSEEEIAHWAAPGNKVQLGTIIVDPDVVGNYPYIIQFDKADENFLNIMKGAESKKEFVYNNLPTLAFWGDLRVGEINN